MHANPAATAIELEGVSFEDERAANHFFEALVAKRRVVHALFDQLAMSIVHRQTSVLHVWPSCEESLNVLGRLVASAQPRSGDKAASSSLERSSMLLNQRKTLENWDWRGVNGVKYGGVVRGGRIPGQEGLGGQASVQGLQGHAELGKGGRSLIHFWGISFSFPHTRQRQGFFSDSRQRHPTTTKHFSRQPTTTSRR